MKVSRAIQTHWQQQHAFEVKLQKEADRRRTLQKEKVKDEIELVLYKRHVQKLQLLKLAKLGKNIDVYS